MPDVTVAICTWNRADALRETLLAIRSMRLPPGVSWELVVVDNGSTDATARVLAACEGLPLRAVEEPRPGIARARLRALAEARAPLLFCTDDDVDVDRDWFGAHLAAALRHPEAGWFGGPVAPRFLEELPPWLVRGLPAVRDAFAVLDNGPEERPLAGSETVYGANMAFRTEVLRRHPFDPAFGSRHGTPFLGEETEAIRRIRAAGHAGIWVPAARVVHRIPAPRMTLSAVGRYFRAVGRTDARAAPPGSPRRRAAHALLRAWVETAPRYALQRLLRADPRRWLRTFRRMHYLRGRAAELWSSLDGATQERPPPPYNPGA